MKIAIIHQKYNAFGGGALVLSDIINFYAADPQNEVTIIVRNWKGDLQSNVKVVKLDGFYIGSILRDELFARSVKKYLATNKFDVVVSDQKIDGIDVYIAGGGSHKGYLARRRQRSGFWSSLGTYFRLFNYYTLYAEEELFKSRQLKKIICVSNLVKYNIIENHDINVNQLTVVYNGIYADKFTRNVERRKEIRDKLQLGNLFTLVFVGSGYQIKNLFTVLDALKNLQNTNLLILGKDSHAEIYRKYAENLGVINRCRFLGAQSPIVDYYSAGDAFILPSYYETFGLVYLEALANGIPVLVSDKAGASEIIENSKHGYVVKHDSVEDIVSKVKLLQAGHFDVNECLHLARQFSVSAMVKNLNDAIKSVL